MQDGTTEEIRDELELQGAALVTALVVAAREGLGQVWGQGFAGAVVEEDAGKMAEPAGLVRGAGGVREQSRGHAG